MKKAIMYGAGNIGRGFIGQLFYEAGYTVTFIDVNEVLLNLLNTEKKYPVRILTGETYVEKWIKQVDGINGDDIAAVAEAISQADIMATAVGVNVLKFIAKPLKEGIVKRFTSGCQKPLDIIICENLIGADCFLRNLIYDLMTEEERTYLERVGFVEASIGRMVPVQTPVMQQGNPLRVCVEKFADLPVDSKAFKGELPPIQTLIPYTPFSYYIERKLFIHNMGHATTAYLAYLNDYQYIWEGIENTDIELLVLRAMQQSAMALSKKYNIPYHELNFHIEDLIYRFANKQLGDTVGRVGGDIKRKLSQNDRMVGAYNLCKEQGVDNSYVAVAIAAALLFEHDGEDKLPADYILTQISGFSSDGEDYQKIMNYYHFFTTKRQLRDISIMIKEARHA